MPSVCFYFQVHQPMRLRHYTVFDSDDRYFDDGKNAAICRKVANKCYLPANRLLLKLIDKHQGRFKVAYSLTGVLLEQLESFSPECDHDDQVDACSGAFNYLASQYQEFHVYSSADTVVSRLMNKHDDVLDKLMENLTDAERIEADKLLREAGL